MNTIVSFTSHAIEQVKQFAAGDPNAKNKYFRVYVEGGGCSGYQYGFTFDEKKPDDLVVPCGDLEAVIDPQSRIYIQGSEIDYTNGLKGSGFTVHNPNSKGTCGCGVSFTV